MKINFNTTEYLARKIVGDLARENMLSKGYELIGYLSLMIKEGLEEDCHHVWMGIPPGLRADVFDSIPILLENKKICKICGVVDE